MSGFAVKGWCPDAWHPMMAGDGLLVRVKPRFGRLTRDQVLELCDAATACGNGLIDMTRRANLQLRGVGTSHWPALLDRLVTLDLVAADAATERRRNILVTPDWRASDDSHRIALELLCRMDELPELPGKVGFVIDAGPAPVLADEAGDFRIERSGNGGLILRADGRATGAAVEPGKEVDALIALAGWFATSGGADAGRMARHRIDLPACAQGNEPPAATAEPIAPGPRGLGAALGLPFGQVEARVLARLAETPGVEAVRTTPWRVLLVEGPPDVRAEGLLHDPADPLLRVDACPGAPHCPQATVETRDLARRIAPRVAGRLHVSGCAKSCASAQPTDVTLTGRDGLFDLVLAAPPGSPPVCSGLEQAEVLAYFGAA